MNLNLFKNVINYFKVKMLILFCCLIIIALIIKTISVLNSIQSYDLSLISNKCANGAPRVMASSKIPIN